MSAEPGFRVKLLRDMTRWAAGLKAGTEGETQLPSGRSALFPTRFLRVDFTPGGVPKTVEVQRSDLEIIDERWLSLQRKEEEEKREALEHHVKQGTLHLGPRGGFQKLVVEYTNERPNDHWTRSKEAQPIVDSLRAKGLLREEKHAG